MISKSPSCQSSIKYPSQDYRLYALWTNRNVELLRWDLDPIVPKLLPCSHFSTFLASGHCYTYSRRSQMVLRKEAFYSENSDSALWTRSDCSPSQHMLTFHKCCISYIQKQVPRLHEKIKTFKAFSELLSNKTMTFTTQVDQFVS